MNDAQIKHMVDRFLWWKLPPDFSPDAGISFRPEFNVEYMAAQGKPPMRHEPVGTNLFSAAQADAMIRHMAEGLPENMVGAAEVEVGQFIYRRIEKLMDATPGTTEAAELTYLADLVASVEEYGALGDEDCAPVAPASKPEAEGSRP